LLKQLARSAQHAMNPSEASKNTEVKSLLSSFRGNWRATTSADCTARTDYGNGKIETCSRTCSYTYHLALTYDPDHTLTNAMTEDVHLSELVCDMYQSIDNKPASDSHSVITSHGGLVESVPPEIALWFGENHISLRRVGDKLQTTVGDTSLTFDHDDGN
jgi:hypothetical protein